jgi:ferric-dicitrate binding protein FerR (iron transport regulator)
MEEPISVELLERYIKGDCTQEEVALVKKWYRSFEYSNDYVSGLGLAEEKDLEEKIYNHILKNIGAPAYEEEPAGRPDRFIFRRWYAIAGVAAAILISITSYLLVTYREKKIKEIQLANVSTREIQDVTNNSDQIYKVVLPDNSAVWLKPNSEITFPKTFDSKSRIISISGECFFEVTKNPKRPFIINSRSIITKVWGTSFLVRDNYRSNTAEVSVLTGKVSVSIKTAYNSVQPSLRLEKGDIMLYPHQKAIYLIDQHVLKPIVDNDEGNLQLWKHVNLFFENKPIHEIIPILNSKFHVHIAVKNEKLNHYILNADLTGFNLPDVLQALKKSLNISYKISDSDIELE